MLLYDYALRFVGIRYRWGGETPMGGFDCSGLVRMLLKSQGIKILGSGNAASLYTQFLSDPKTKKLDSAQLGALVFYQDSIERIDHVSMALTDNSQIEAAGGDHTTLTIEDAIVKRAFVRVSRIRSNNVAILLPNYGILESNLLLQDSL